MSAVRKYSFHSSLNCLHTLKRHYFFSCLFPLIQYSCTDCYGLSVPNSSQVSAISRRSQCQDFSRHSLTYMLKCPYVQGSAHVSQKILCTRSILVYCVWFVSWFGFMSHRLVDCGAPSCKKPQRRVLAAVPPGTFYGSVHPFGVFCVFTKFSLAWVLYNCTHL